MRTSMLLVLILVPTAVWAEDAPPPSAVLFGKKCGGCHTIGQGDRTGPDLLGVLDRRKRDWIGQFVRNPNAFLDSDPASQELLTKFKNVRMPEQQLTDDDIVGLLDYFAACTKAGGCKLVLGKVKHASEANAQEIARGRALFEGRERLGGGGAACISCHNVRGVGPVGGGTLAKDLTFAYARLGDTGVQAALESTPFPLMKDHYPKRPLRDYEVYAIKSFLAQSAKDGTQPRRDPNFIYLGLLGLFVSLGALGAVGSGRMRGVRKNLVSKGNHK